MGRRAPRDRGRRARARTRCGPGVALARAARTPAVEDHRDRSVAGSLVSPGEAGAPGPRRSSRRSAEALPLADASVDAALAVNSVSHWGSRQSGPGRARARAQAGRSGGASSCGCATSGRAGSTGPRTGSPAGSGPLSLRPSCGRPGWDPTARLQRPVRRRSQARAAVSRGSRAGLEQRLEVAEDPGPAAAGALGLRLAGDHRRVSRARPSRSWVTVSRVTPPCALRRSRR